MSRKPIQIEGLSGLKAKLALATTEARAAAEAAVVAETHAVRDDADEGAPKLSGELAGSIEADVNGTEGRVTAKSRHALFQEYGTFKDSAQPYMHPAAERSRSRFGRRAGILIKAALEAIRG